MTLNWTSATVSDRGGRGNNQDFCAAWQEEEKSCWIVADGLGGHRGGDIAARVVGDALLERGRQGALSRAWLTDAFAHAQEVLHQRQSEDGLNDMRTTAVMLARRANQVLWGHVGDSRCYHFRDGIIHSMTRDHSVPQMLVHTGEIDFDQIRRHPDRNLLLRTLGGADRVLPAAPPSALTVHPNDAFLLCSDGFWEHVLEVEMETDLQGAKSCRDWLETMVHRLVERARGDFDNFSAITVTVTPSI